MGLLFGRGKCGLVTANAYHKTGVFEKYLKRDVKPNRNNNMHFVFLKTKLETILKLQI